MSQSGKLSSGIHRLKRVAMLGAVSLFLTGCGPHSLTRFLPHPPHIYFLQNTSPIHAAPEQLIVSATQLPPGFKQTSSIAASNKVLTGMSLNPQQQADAFREYHRLNGALATYVRSLSLNAFGISVQTVQIDVGLYASLHDAVDYMHWVAAHPPHISSLQVLPDPRVAPTYLFYGSNPPLLSMAELYFQARNAVVRVIVIGPASSSSQGVAIQVADNEQQRISSAP